jgi:hypothetical protein
MSFFLLPTNVSFSCFSTKIWFEQFPLNCKAPLIKEIESLSTFLELERLLIAKMTQKWHEDHRPLSVRIGFRALCSRVNCSVGIISMYLWRLNSRLLICFMYVVHFSLIALHKWKGICVEASKASFSSSVLLVCKWRSLYLLIWDFFGILRQLQI